MAKAKHDIGDDGGKLMLARKGAELELWQIANIRQADRNGVLKIKVRGNWKFCDYSEAVEG